MNAYDLNEASGVLAPSGAFVITGHLRLLSVRAYGPMFAAAEAAMRHPNGQLVIDLVGVEFMNSSAVTALSRLILRARAATVRLTLRGNASLHWHGVTLRALGRLYPGAIVEMV